MVSITLLLGSTWTVLTQFLIAGDFGAEQLASLSALRVAKDILLASICAALYWKLPFYFYRLTMLWAPCKQELRHHFKAVLTSHWVLLDGPSEWSITDLWISKKRPSSLLLASVNLTTTTNFFFKTYFFKRVKSNGVSSLSSWKSH